MSLIELFYNPYLLSGTIIIVISLFIIFLNLIRSSKRKALVAKYFEGHVSEEVMKKLKNSNGDLGLFGEERVITVIFNDIRSFSELSERWTNKEVLRFINDYYSLVSKILLGNNATIDKFLGDGVMAFWGAPLSTKNQAYSAITSSLEIIEAVEERDELGDIDVGVGISTGPMIVGNLGKGGYTVIGDNVNLASRLESLNKQYGSKILVDENFINKLEQEQLHDSTLKELFYREIDLVRVFGISKKTSLYEIYGYSDSISDKQFKGFNYFAEGLRNYRKQKWERAEGNFRLSHRLLEGDPVSKTFIERCKEYKKVPYHTTWDGHYAFVSK